MTTTVFEPSDREAPTLTEREWPPQGEWTYEDYRRLPDDGWIYEVIVGLSIPGRERSSFFSCAMRLTR